MRSSIFDPLNPDYRVYRDFLKHFPMELISEEVESDQATGKPCPRMEKSAEKNLPLISLPRWEDSIFKKRDIARIFAERESRRVYSKEAIALEELSFLLWATQGIRKVIQIRNGQGALKTVPSAGARHPFETYLVVKNITGLEPGLYRYCALEKSVVFLKPGDFSSALATACFDQSFAADAAVTFVWSVIPYRTEWRYGYLSHKPIALDAGHVCQNLYLGCEALELGTCAIAAYDQKKIDALVDLDGIDEFIIYIAPVGHYEKRNT